MLGQVAEEEEAMEEEEGMAVVAHLAGDIPLVVEALDIMPTMVDPAMSIFLHGLLLLFSL